MNKNRRHRASLSISELERFCHFVGQSLASGQSFVESLRSYGRAGAWDVRPTIDAVLEGQDAASALKRFGGFPQLLIGMVEVGEASGKLDQTFLRLAEYYRELIRSQRIFRQGIFWPALQLIAAATVLCLLFFALDYLQRTVTVIVAPDLFGLGLQPLGNMILVIVIACICLSGLGLLSWWMLRGRLPSSLSSVLRRLPWVGTVWQRITTSRFAWALGAAIDAGTDAVHAVRLAVRGSSNTNYQKIEKQLIESLQQGESFENALAATRRFPPELLQAVALGESTGQLSECVQRLSRDYDEQNALSLRRFGQVSGMVVSLSVAVLLGFTVVSMYTRYMQMVSGALRANSQTLEEMRGAMLAGSIDSERLLGSASDSVNSFGNQADVQDRELSAAQQDNFGSGSDSDNELIQTRDRMVEDFVENNQDFKAIESIYGTLSRYGEMTPNEFLDAIAGEPRSKQRSPSGASQESKPKPDEGR